MIVYKVCFFFNFIFLFCLYHKSWSLMVIFYSLVSSLTKFSIEKEPVNFKCKEEKNIGFGFGFFFFLIFYSKDSDKSLSLW